MSTIKDILGIILSGAGGAAQTYGKYQLDKSASKNDLMNSLVKLKMASLLEQEDPYRKALTAEALARGEYYKSGGRGSKESKTMEFLQSPEYKKQIEDALIARQTEVAKAEIVPQAIEGLKMQAGALETKKNLDIEKGKSALWDKLLQYGTAVSPAVGAVSAVRNLGKGVSAGAGAVGPYISSLLSKATGEGDIESRYTGEVGDIKGQISGLEKLFAPKQPTAEEIVAKSQQDYNLRDINKLNADIEYKQGMLGARNRALDLQGQQLDRRTQMDMASTYTKLMKLPGANHTDVMLKLAELFNVDPNTAQDVIMSPDSGTIIELD